MNKVLGLILALSSSPTVHADCNQLVAGIAEVEKPKPPIELSYVTNYDEGLKRVSPLLALISTFADLKKNDPCRTEHFHKVVELSIALSPFDQESEIARQLAAETVKDKVLKSIYDDTVVKFEEANAKDLTKWCRGERLQKMVTSFECERKWPKRKPCKDPNFSYTACAHIAE